MRLFINAKKIITLELLKKPTSCISKEEIRKHIDAIDREIINLFALRFEYVHEIVKFKTDHESVVALERKNEVIKVRGKWADELGLDRETFEHLYTVLIDHNISKELEILKKNQLM